MVGKKSNSCTIGPNEEGDDDGDDDGNCDGEFTFDCT
jgi:hypothetical protein